MIIDLTEFSFVGMLICLEIVFIWTSWIEFQLTAKPLQHSFKHFKNIVENPLYIMATNTTEANNCDIFSYRFAIVHCPLSILVGHFRFNVWNVFKCFFPFVFHASLSANTIPYALFTIHNVGISFEAKWILARLSLTKH